ncbi:MAG: acetyl-CoA C-acetyltransferase [Gammaproteobacteria bacterium]|jgi:acetyl-CoA C-acetyltransferase|nr:acetyl-CoA C-acetyltransferase [Gammaproteobacteria bacterium]
MSDAFIFDHIRTPRGRGKSDGALHSITPMSLMAQTLAELRNRNSLDTRLVDDVVLGCVSPVGEQGANIARVATLIAGYDECVAGQQVNRFCASGLEAINIAAGQVMSGQSIAAIGGGVESMSRVAMGSDGGAWYSDPAVSYPAYYVPQGIGADLIATIDGYDRARLDSFAAESQRRATLAWNEGRFAKSVMPVRNLVGEIVLARDEHIRADTTIESLGQLKAAFAIPGEKLGFDVVAQLRYPQVESINHLHTAGNSSGIVDGAAAVLVGGTDFAGVSGLQPRARIRAFTSIGSEPAIMLTGPALVTEKLLKRAGMTIGDIDLFEINEAFAAVALRFITHFDLPPDRVNVNGGAIAMGHPLGATGAMILGTVLDELERQDLNTALVTLCVGAGMGTAAIIERV